MIDTLAIQTNEFSEHYKLKELLRKAYPPQELPTLCHSLHINPEDIVRDSHAETIAELVEYVERRDFAHQLLETCRAQRPRFNWPDATTFVPEQPATETAHLDQPLDPLRNAAPAEESFTPAQIHEDIEQAEQSIRDGRHEKAGDELGKAAERLIQRQQAAQARKYAHRSAHQYMLAEKKNAAILQYVQAIEAWLSQTTYEPFVLLNDLREAEKLLDAGQWSLQTRLWLAKAKVYFALGYTAELQQTWAELPALLNKMYAGQAQRTYLTQLALQQAAYARVQNRWSDAETLLRQAIQEWEWPAETNEILFDLLKVLMFLYAEQGQWQKADEIYDLGLARFLSAGRLENLWRMHHAATLARRGALSQAYDTYMKIKTPIDKLDDPERHHFYQDMMCMLTQYSTGQEMVSVMAFDAPRLDLWTEVGRVNLAHQEGLHGVLMATADRLPTAVRQAEAALGHYWQAAQWAGVRQTQQILSKLYRQNNQPVLALVTAVRAGDRHLAQAAARQLLSVTTPDTIHQALAPLLVIRPAMDEQEAALKALTILGDLIPADLLPQAITLLMELAQKPKKGESGQEVRRYAVEALRQLALQFSLDQTNEVVQLATAELDEEAFYTIHEELLFLLNICFARPIKIQAKLFRPAWKAILGRSNRDFLRTEAEAAMASLAQQAPTAVRQEVVAYLRQSERPLAFCYLASLGEKLTPSELSTSVNWILDAITPEPDSKGLLAYSYIPATALNFFNDLLPAHPELYNRVIDGLLAAVRNPHGLASTQREALITLPRLPEKVWQARASEIATLLLTILRGEGVKLGENEAEFRQYALAALGSLLHHSNEKLQDEIVQTLLAEYQTGSLAGRLGTAQALGAMEPSPVTAVQALLFTSLHDAHAEVRTWAARAAGVWAAQGHATSEILLESLLVLAQTEREATVRAGIATALKMAHDKGKLKAPLKRRVTAQLAQLGSDVHFRVRQATA